MLDFEISIHQVIITVSPTAQIWGCRFHLGQTQAYHKIQSLSFAQNCNIAAKNDELGKWQVHIFGLSFFFFLIQ